MAGGVCVGLGGNILQTQCPRGNYRAREPQRNLWQQGSSWQTDSYTCLCTGLSGGAAPWLHPWLTPQTAVQNHNRHHCSVPWWIRLCFSEEKSPTHFSSGKHQQQRDAEQVYWCAWDYMEHFAHDSWAWHFFFFFLEIAADKNNCANNRAFDQITHEQDSWMRSPKALKIMEHLNID